MSVQRLRPQVALRCTTHLIDRMVPSGQVIISGAAAFDWLEAHHAMIDRHKDVCSAIHAVDTATINGPLVMLHYVGGGLTRPAWKVSGPHIGELTDSWTTARDLFVGIVVGYLYHYRMLQLEAEQ